MYIYDKPFYDICTMAKIKVKFRPSTIRGKRGLIYYYVSHRQDVRHITTPFRILPEEWDEERQDIVSGKKELEWVRHRIECDMGTLQKIVGELMQAQAAFSADDIVARFHEPERHVCLLSYFQEQIWAHTACNRLGTATNYRSAFSRLSSFLTGRSPLLSEVNTRFVEEYQDHLQQRGIARNSLSFHMRILRAVYNKAVRHGLIEQTFPFRNVYTGIDHTRKRAVSEDIITQMMRLNLEKHPSLAFARDMFLFSFFTRGMAFVDIVFLRKSNVQDGFIRYTRHKTGQQLTVRIESCMKAIIDRYAPFAENTPYLFPMLTQDDAKKSFAQYKSELRSYNNRLMQISRMLGLGDNISSYTSRHSWATAARNHNIPVSIISAGMGHTSERTTQIYLASIEDTLVDNANKGLLDSFRL